VLLAGIQHPLALPHLLLQLLLYLAPVYACVMHAGVVFHVLQQRSVLIMKKKNI
jgi:hypothetical protein